MPRTHDQDAQVKDAQVKDAQLFVYLSWKTQAGLPILESDEIQQAAHLAIAHRARAQFSRILAIGNTSREVHMVVRFPASLSVSIIARTSRVSAQQAISQLLGLYGQPAATASVWESDYTAHTLSREDADEATAYLRARITDANAARLP